MSSTEKKQRSPEEIQAARQALEAAEKAEFMQAVMSLYIPLSLFISCCVFAAGAFMVYYEEPAGWGFIGATVVIALSAFIALFKFQNKFRAKGIIPTKDTVVESNIVDMSVPQERTAGDAETIDNGQNSPESKSAVKAAESQEAAVKSDSKAVSV